MKDPSRYFTFHILRALLLANSVLIFVFILAALLSEIMGARLLIEIQFAFMIINFILFLRYMYDNESQAALSDAGFVVSGFLLCYTVFPILQYLTGFYVFTGLGNLDLSYENISDNTYRHILFQLMFQFAYASINFNSSRVTASQIIGSPSDFVVVVSFLAFVLTIAILDFFSSPIETYYDNYTRYDHLDAVTRKIVSVAVRVYRGLLPFLIMFAFLKFRQNFFLMFAIILLLCSVDIYITRGARIQALMTIVQAVGLYCLLVGPIKFYRLLLAVFIVIFGFTLVEVVRLSTGNFVEVVENMSTVAGEFNSLYYPEIHLYELRETNSIPDYNVQMIFKDVITLIPFVSFDGVSPMIWYWKNFHPSVPHAPFTLGPISDSAIWGGVIGLIFRAIALAFVLGFLRRVLLNRSSGWVKVCAYSYVVSVGVLSLKYGVLTPLEQLIKNWSVGFMLVTVIGLIGVSFHLYRAHHHSYLKTSP